MTIDASGLRVTQLLGERRLDWVDVGSIREIKRGLLPPRLRYLIVRFAGRKGPVLTRVMFGGDWALYIGGLDRPREEILSLVERFSGDPVERVP